MQLLMSADTVGGVWTYAVELARALGFYGTRVTLAAVGPAPSDAQRAQVALLEHVELRARPGKLEWMREPWDDVERTGAWLRDLAGELRPDVVHLNDYAHGALDWPAPHLVVGHSCVLSWFEAVRGSPAPEGWSRYRERVRAGLAGARFVVAPTATMLAALERHYGPLPPARVVHNGIALSEARRPRAKEPFVLGAGRLWDEAKGAALLAAVAPRVGWPVVLAGDTTGPDGRPTRLEHARCLGRVPARELALWYERAAVFAHPARYEPFGLTPLEAAARGCALVLAGIDSLRELWQGVALFVEPGDADGLARTLRALVQDPGLRARHAALCAQRARRFGVRRMATAYRGLYEELLRGPPAPAGVEVGRRAEEAA